MTGDGGTAPVGDGAPRDPDERDVDLAVSAHRRVGVTELRRSDDAARCCGACRFYLDPDQDLAYCWHPSHRSLVDAGWVCGAFDRDRLREV